MLKRQSCIKKCIIIIPLFVIYKLFILTYQDVFHVCKNMLFLFDIAENTHDILRNSIELVLIQRQIIIKFICTTQSLFVRHLLKNQSNSLLSWQARNSSPTSNQIIHRLAAEKWNLIRIGYQPQMISCPLSFLDIFRICLNQFSLRIIMQINNNVIKTAILLTSMTAAFPDCQIWLHNLQT